MYPIAFTYRGAPVMAVVQAYAQTSGLSAAAGMPWFVSVGNRGVQQSTVLVIAHEDPAETIRRLSAWLDLSTYSGWVDRGASDPSDRD